MSTFLVNVTVNLKGVDQMPRVKTVLAFKGLRRRRVKLLRHALSMVYTMDQKEFDDAQINQRDPIMFAKAGTPDHAQEIADLLARCDAALDERLALSTITEVVPE